MINNSEVWFGGPHNLRDDLPVGQYLIPKDPSTKEGIPPEIGTAWLSSRCAPTNSSTPPCEGLLGICDPTTAGKPMGLPTPPNTVINSY